MKVDRKTFGVLSSGKKVHLYKLKAGDISLCLCTLGASWTSLVLPSRDKGSDDILLGVSTFDGFVRNLPLWTMEEPALARAVWKADAYEERDGVFVRFEYEGDITAAISYGLTKSNEIVANYEARLEKPAPFDLDTRAWFNLAGENRGISVNSTEFTIMEDNNPLDGKPDELKLSAEFHEPFTGRRMRVFNTKTAVKIINWDRSFNEGKMGSVYQKDSGFCLKTTKIQNPNCQGKTQPEFFTAGDFAAEAEYHEKAVYAFDW